MKINYKKYLNIIGRAIVALSIVIVIIVSIVSMVYSIAMSGGNSATDLANVWVDSRGEPFSLDSFSSTTEDGSQSQRVYYTTVVSNIDTALIFRCRNCFVNIYINGRPAYEDDTDIALMYGKSPGSRWHNIAIGVSNEPVDICLEVTPVYYDSKGLIDNIYLGSVSDIARIVTSLRIPGFIISAFLVLFGIILMLLYFYLKNHFTVEKDLLYLGVATFFTAVYLSSESLLWQFFYGHSEVFHLIGYLALIPIPMAFGLLACQRLKGRMKIFSQFYSIVCSINFIIVTLLHVFGILEFHYSLTPTHILLVLMVPILVLIVLSYTSDKKHSNSMIYTLLIVLVFSVIISLTKYRGGSYGDFSTYMRIAILCFLFDLIVCQLGQAAETFSMGLKANMMHDMALTDHMTRLFNRTAYAEHTADYNHMIDSFSPLGIIQFDVNNLKKVNDTLGHEKGDQMIMAVADGLREAFPENVDLYRMGGDEFLAVINCLDPESIYEEGVKRLNKYCDRHNKHPEHGFTLQIAHGFTIIKGNKSLSEALEEADELMYKNKRELKSHNA